MLLKYIEFLCRHFLYFKSILYKLVYYFYVLNLSTAFRNIRICIYVLLYEYRYTMRENVLQVTAVSSYPMGEQLPGIISKKKNLRQTYIYVSCTVTIYLKASDENRFLYNLYLLGKCKWPHSLYTTGFLLKSLFFLTFYQALKLFLNELRIN